jgi:hypothetical protein
MKTSSPGQPPPLERTLTVSDGDGDGSAGSVAEPSPEPRPNPLVGAIVLAAIVSGISFVHFADRMHLPWPVCALRQWTGVPCPGCGTTRSLLAWAELRPVEALRLNPLLACVMVGVIVWAALHLSDHYCKTRGLAVLRAWSNSAVLLRVVIVAALLNWIYLWIMLPQ